MRDIVWAEDSGSDQVLIQTVLDESDPPVDVAFADDGEEALRLVARHRPRLVVLDLHMPRRGGLEVLRALRADAAHATTPVVVFTSSSLPQELAAAQALGAVAFLQKPIAFGAFRAAVRTILGHPALASPPAQPTRATPAAAPAQGAGQHHVLFWDDEALLLDAARGFLQDARGKGHGTVALATPRHLAHLKGALPGDDTIWLDAEQVLLALGARGDPDPARFVPLLEDAVRRASRDGTRAVSCFGELVALLHERGHARAALAIEATGQQAAARAPGLSILCAYPVAIVAPAAVPATCALHTSEAWPAGRGPLLPA